MLSVRQIIRIVYPEIHYNPIRAQGSGGQNVNKVASAVQLRFDIRNSNIPERYKDNLLKLSDQRITKDGEIVLKAQKYRTQEKNKEDALQRLVEMIRTAGYKQKARTPSKPTRNSKKRRVDSKTKRGKLKSLRSKVKPE